MNFADIETTWRSPHNGPSPAQLKSMQQSFIAELQRRRRGTHVFIGLIVVVLTAITAMLVTAYLRPSAESRPILFGREWAVWVMLLIPWVGAAVIGRHVLRHGREHQQFERSLGDSVRALLDENRVSRLRVKTVAYLHGALLLILPVVVHQLRVAGKAGPEIVVPAFVVWPLLSVGILLALSWHYRTTLLPRKHELETLLKQYE